MNYEARIDQLKQDCLTMALRLIGESPDSLGPECREVMDRWKHEVSKAFGGMDLNAIGWGD